MLYSSIVLVYFFFFNDTATTEIYTLSLHDALPIYAGRRPARPRADERPLRRALFGRAPRPRRRGRARVPAHRDRKSTRLNSSHANISYAVFCLKKKKKNYDSNHVQTSLLVKLTRYT